MANFKTTNDQAYPTTSDNKLTENDPMIVKVPMADMKQGRCREKRMTACIVSKWTAGKSEAFT